ncbi:MAG TPA: hypothetical protein VNO30_40870 [Kofleriaceae bacterium]|nr:hypothetical protein [Kofleriaceae bacterium]
MDTHAPDFEEPRADPVPPGRAAESPGRAAAPTPHGLRERLGEIVGRLLAPAIHAIARLRGSRMFHPVGHTFSGRATAVPGPLGSIGEQLAGRVLARCSPALSKTGREWLEVLGIALRFRPGGGPPLDHHATLGDQDLLFATVSSPLLLLAAPLLTDAHDFVRSRYWATAPFVVHGHGRVELRLVPALPAAGAADTPAPGADAGSREARLRAAVAAGRAAWWLEARPTLTLDWHPVARIELAAPAAVDVVDDDALRFDPFRAGAGLVPVGFVHAIRRAAYAASQRARR